MRAYLFLLIAAMSWSGNFVIARAMNDSIPPISLAYWRWQFAFLIILPFALPKLRQQWHLIQAHWRVLTLLGVVGVGSFNTLVYIGLQTTTATNALLINSNIPLLIIVLGMLFFAHPIRLKSVLGIFMSFTGVLFILTQGHWENIAALSLNQGDLWVLFAALCWALYSLWLKWKPTEIDGLVFLTFTMGIGALVLAPFYWFNLLNEAPLNWNFEMASALAYVSVVASLIAYAAWNAGVKLAGPAIAGQFIHFMPVFGIIWAWIFLGERWQSYHVIGAALTAGGVLFSLDLKSLLKQRANQN